MIAQIRSDGIATLIVDRNYRQVSEHADRLLVLRKGRSCSPAAPPNCATA